jgi:hypothetical protein
MTIYTIRTGGIELTKYTNRKSKAEGKGVKSFVPTEKEMSLPFKVIRFEDKEEEEVVVPDPKSPRDIVRGQSKEKGQNKNESSAFLTRKGSELNKSMKLNLPLKSQEPKDTHLNQPQTLLTDKHEKSEKDKKCLVM